MNIRIPVMHRKKNHDLSQKGKKGIEDGHWVTLEFRLGRPPPRKPQTQELNRITSRTMSQNSKVILQTNLDSLSAGDLAKCLRLVPPDFAFDPETHIDLESCVQLRVPETTAILNLESVKVCMCCVRNLVICTFTTQISITCLHT